MFLSSLGIVLQKNHSSLYKMVILDKMQGKIECASSAPSFPIGTLITYTFHSEKNTTLIHDSALVYSPLSLAGNDILFFHHVIELVYYFTQIGNCAKDVFNLMMFLYATEIEKLTTHYKKIFLLKLLTCMGGTPDIDHFCIDTITQLNNIDIKHINSATIDTIHEKNWIDGYGLAFGSIHMLMNLKRFIF